MKFDKKYFKEELDKYFGEKDDAIKEKIASLKDDFKITTLSLIIYDCAVLIEHLAGDVANVSKEKRDAIVEFLDESIELNWVLEKFDGFVIGKAVDEIIDLLNTAHGKEWAGKVRSIL